jgi:diketogulonate reductase-like aldo/keto reductase
MQFCKSHNILVQAYSPLGNNPTGELRTVDDATVQALAQKLNKDAGQLLISWGVQKGMVVLPKSVTPSRIRSNFQTFRLPENVITELDALERHKRFNFPVHWGVDIFEEVGEEIAKKTALDWAEKNKKV